ncbi:MAG: hypothetical protein C7B45_05345 [Sulfobacillus acidophilus]|uniref:DUF2029 domain-containing protein n=1 Tax=Sulfobacillus acidophilus TaxID=53633 RepID=A0A2T2WKL1_9FIRM|nr:MAG: hypothetical protein C7B45_05345 [Sulfobacillus acidophilus]
MRSHLQLFMGSLAITLYYLWSARHLIPPPSVRASQSLTTYANWAYAHLAYSDIWALYFGHHLMSHALPYIQTPIEYPVLMGLTMWVTAWIPGGALGFFLATAVLLWAAALWCHYCIWEFSPAHAWAFSLTPLVMTYGLLNWDMLGMALMLWAVRLFRQACWNRSAIVFAMAVFFKLFPIFCLPFIAVRIVRSEGLRRLWSMVTAFGAAACALNVPFAITNWNNWSLFFNFNAGRGVSADLWNNTWWHLASVPAVDLLSLTMVSCALVVCGHWMGPDGSWAEASAVVFAIFLLVNKVFSPQYILWLTAFAAMAQWPLWTFALLSVAGLTDYVNSLTMLHLTASGAPTQTTAQWYGQEIFPLGLALRYLAVVISPLGALYGRWRHPTEVLHPLYPSDPQISPDI